MDFSSLEDSIPLNNTTSNNSNHYYPFRHHSETTPTLLSLPTEIHLRITLHLTQPPYPPTTNPTTTLKSLRLTHPAFTPLPTPYLFSHLTLPLWGPRGLLRLHHIALHEHLARHVQHVKFWVQFNLAEPHPAPFQEGNLRRVGEDLLGVREVVSRRRDRFRKSVSGKFEGLSLRGRRTSKFGKGVADGNERGGRNASVVSTASSNDGERKQSVLPSIPDLSVDPLEFLKMFDRMASTTISRNLAAAEVTYAAERNAGPSPMLMAMMRFVSEIFGKLDRLQTLCVDSQTQDEFMERLDRGFALRYAPTQDTWDAISRYVVAMVLAGWVRSDCASVRRLWVLGGAVGTWEVLMKEYLRNERKEEQVVWRENGIEGASQMSSVGNGCNGPTGLELWKQKAATLESLSVKYDVGAYRVYFVSVETRWMAVVRELMQDMPRLQYLEIGKQKRADGTIHDRSGWAAVRLTNIVAEEESEGTVSPNLSRIVAERAEGAVIPNLKLLRLSDLQVQNTVDLKKCLEALGGEGLERLHLGNFHIGTDDWPAAWKMLREDCQFRLKQFVLMGKSYGSDRGVWQAKQISSFGRDEAPTPLISEVQEYVENKGEHDRSPLLLTSEATATAAVGQWQRRGDVTLRYQSSES